MILSINKVSLPTDKLVLLVCKRKLFDCQAGFPSSKLALLADKAIPSIGKAAWFSAEVIPLLTNLVCHMAKPDGLQANRDCMKAKPNGTLTLHKGIPV